MAKHMMPNIIFSHYKTLKLKIKEEIYNLRKKRLPWGFGVSPFQSWSLMLGPE